LEFKNGDGFGDVYFEFAEQPITLPERIGNEIASLTEPAEFEIPTLESLLKLLK